MVRKYVNKTTHQIKRTCRLLKDIMLTQYCIMYQMIRYRFQNDSTIETQQRPVKEYRKTGNSGYVIIPLETRSSAKVVSGIY